MRTTYRLGTPVGYWWGDERRLCARSFMPRNSCAREHDVPLPNHEMPSSNERVTESVTTARGVHRMHAMDEQSRGDAAVRLSRIAGQVAGLQRMVAEDRYCVDVLLQVAAVRAALAEVSKVVLANHVQTCLTEALRSGGKAERRVKVDELMDIFSRYCGLGMPSRAPARVGRSSKNK
jgi:CsoR family transcriptional regulator, copper-sensing transcriptional repressor